MRPWTSAAQSEVPKLYRKTEGMQAECHTVFTSKRKQWNLIGSTNYLINSIEEALDKLISECQAQNVSWKKVGRIANDRKYPNKEQE